MTKGLAMFIFGLLLGAGIGQIVWPYIIALLAGG